MRLVFCLVLVLGGLQLASALLVGAWNIQVFGPKKANLPGALGRNPTPQEEQKAKEILKYIATVVRGYDVIVIQEVRDKDDNNLQVVKALMDILNKPTVPANNNPPLNKNNQPKAPQTKLIASPAIQKNNNNRRRAQPRVNNNQQNSGSSVYASIVSERLGDNNHKERYVYIYKISTVRYSGQNDNFQYPNPNNEFRRPPFAVKFRAKAGAVQDFVMVPLHATPGSGVTLDEINALDDVVQAVYTKWKNKNMPILLLGDFNAAGAFLSPRSQQNNGLTDSKKYKWLLPPNKCTNVAGNCAYDRIVANTAMIKHAYDADVSCPFKNLPRGVTEKEISDHYPVQVKLR